MSCHIPFDIQSLIIERLLVKSLVKFRSVSKQWKSFIDDPEFIKNYHINHTNPQHHLLVSFNDLHDVQSFTSILDNNTFPQQKFPLTAPKSLSLLEGTSTLSFVDGLLVIYGRLVDLGTGMAVIWNPSIRKSVDIVFPIANTEYYHVVGFGICLDTSDPKLVKISVDTGFMWEVEVFTLSTRAWKPVYTGAPCKSCRLSCGQVSVDGVIYFCAYYDDRYRGTSIHVVVSFNLKSEMFGDVCLPESIVQHLDLLDVAKVNDSLGLLEYCDEGGVCVCGVWTREDGANKPFTKIYIVKVDGKTVLRNVLGFRYNGEVVTELRDYGKGSIKVYEPLSGHTNGVGIIREQHGTSM